MLSSSTVQPSILLDRTTASIEKYQRTNPPPQGTTIKVQDGRGKSLIGTKGFAAGEIILKERALVALQHEENREQGVIVCQHCLRFLGPLVLQFIALLQAKGGERAEALAESLQECGLPFSDPSDDGGTAISPQNFLPKPYPCRKDCGDLYCCADCEEQAWHSSHQFLCCNAGKSAKKFKEHATETNELLQLAAKVVIRTLNSMSHTTARSDSRCTDGFETTVKTAWGPFSTIMKEEWRKVVKASDDLDADSAAAASDSEDIGDGDKATLEESIDLILGESIELLRPILLPNSRQKRGNKRARTEHKGSAAGASASSNPGQELDDDLNQRAAAAELLLSAPVFGAIMGMFELNNCGVVVESPALAYLRRISALPPHQRRTALRTLRPILTQLRAQPNSDDDGGGGESDPAANHSGPASGGCGERGSRHRSVAGGEKGRRSGGSDEGGVGDQGDGDLGDENEWRELFPACEGSGLFAWQSSMNHACRPNCVIFPPPPDAVDGDIVVRAARPIEAGEELTVSYIEEGLDLAGRRRALGHYGFHCDCSRCREEEAAGAPPGTASG